MFPVPVLAAALAMVGGYAPVDPHDVLPMADFAVRHLPRGHARLRRIERAETQVVAGMNVRLRLRLRDGACWQATVWQKLDGTMELTARQPCAGRTER